jgi:hypothetical protein
MSLVGDALRKARQEAAERDSDRRGVLFSAKIADRPVRSNLGLGLALGALIAIVATVVGGLAVWWLFVRSTPEHQPSLTAMRAAPVAAAEPDADDGNQLRQPAAEDGGTGGRQGQPLRSTAVSAEQPPIDPDPVPDPEDSSAAVGASGADPPDSGVAERVDPAEGEFLGIEDGAEVYLMEAMIDGVVLSLDYLVFRTEDPFAEINGLEVHIGATIEGFRVKAIERDRVHLSNGRREIVLRAP